MHPFYLRLEEDGNAHGVFLLNSNAMGRCPWSENVALVWECDPNFWSGNVALFSWFGKVTQIFGLGMWLYFPGLECDPNSWSGNVAQFSWFGNVFTV